MECDHLHISRLKEGSLNVSRITPKFTVEKAVDGGVRIRPRDGVTLAVIAVDDVAFTAERICMTSTGSVLVVSPEVVWLNEGNGFSADFDVMSNVDWNIE